MNWTDERVGLLKKLWAEGFSASQIAAQLGGVTRNAVIGKAHRLKLAGRTKAQPRLRKNSAPSGQGESAAFSAASSAQAGKGGQSRRRSHAGVAVIGATALQIEEEEEAQAYAQPRPRGNVVVSMARKLTLMQLTEHTCKWPMGDPLSEDFYFCGADSGESGPYCACHAKLAFNADKKKS